MILCSGAFDGLHSGHVRYLQAAHRIDPTQVLRVSIAPDTYIRREKHREPSWSQMDRAQVVFALACVDEITLQKEDTVAATIRDLKPSVFAKGPDWKGRLPDDVLEACHAIGATIHFLQTPGTHTRDVLR